MTWLDTTDRRARLSRRRHPGRARRFTPAVEPLEARDNPVVLFPASICGSVFVDTNGDKSCGAAEAVSVLRNLLVRRMAGQLADYEAIVDRYGVDAVLVDLCALGGQALHERRGLPWATLGISPLTMTSPDTPTPIWLCR